MLGLGEFIILPPLAEFRFARAMFKFVCLGEFGKFCLGDLKLARGDISTTRRDAFKSPRGDCR